MKLMFDGYCSQASDGRFSGYKNVVVRVQFPDQIILQGVFTPSNTIEDVTNFIKQHLQEPEKPFHICKYTYDYKTFPVSGPKSSYDFLIIAVTTPLKENLDPEMTLLQANFVPCVHLHFKWWSDTGSQICLKEEIYQQQTSSDAASILASKYR